MSIEWFIYNKNSVSGPFSTEDVKGQLSTETVDDNSFIWWKGEKDWIPVTKWAEDFETIIVKLEENLSELWRVKHSDSVSNYMSFDEAVEYVKNLQLEEGILINKKDAPQWESVYSHTVFLNALEMSRRQFPRVPIVANAKISKADSKFSYLVKANMIGQGGVGIHGLGKNFSIGTVIDLRLESPSLNGVIHAEATVIYHTDLGTSGVRFNALNAESQSLIVEYVNRFQNPSAKKQTAA